LKLDGSSQGPERVASRADDPRLGPGSSLLRWKRPLRGPTGRAIALALVGIAYAATLFPGVGGIVNHGDSAKFQFLGAIGGVSHPPGNPLYLILNAIAVHASPLPASLTVALLSALFALLALHLLGLAAELLAPNTGAGALAIACVGLGPLFWTFATEAEVYSLNAALISLTVYSGVRHALEAERRWLLICVAASVISLANHLTAVMLMPAVALLALPYLRGASKGDWLKLGAVMSGASAAVVILYAYVPIRVLNGARYSEFHEALGADALWRYVTAAQYQQHLTIPALRVLIEERLPRAIGILSKQWMWPTLAAPVLGWYFLARRSPRLAAFFLVGIASLTAFALVYQIDDPEGFYIPIVVLLGLPMACAVALWQQGRSQILWAAAVMALCVPLAFEHWGEARSRPSQELVEGLDELGEVAWDFPDVVARVPEHARILAPCGHYGCVQVLNYFRFADKNFARKHLAIAHLPGRPEGWHAPWAALDPATPGPEPICTLLPLEAQRLASFFRVRRIDREPIMWRERPLARPPIFCRD
jgi:hypothetical protein